MTHLFSALALEQHRKGDLPKLIVIIWGLHVFASSYYSGRICCPSVLRWRDVSAPAHVLSTLKPTITLRNNSSLLQASAWSVVSCQTEQKKKANKNRNLYQRKTEQLETPVVRYIIIVSLTGNIFSQDLLSFVVLLDATSKDTVRLM